MDRNEMSEQNGSSVNAYGSAHTSTALTLIHVIAVCYPHSFTYMLLTTHSFSNMPRTFPRSNYYEPDLSEWALRLTCMSSELVSREELPRWKGSPLEYISKLVKKENDTDGQTDGQTDRRTDGQTGMQIQYLLRCVISTFILLFS